MFPEDVKKYIDAKGFKKVRRVEKKDLIRANPDTDNYIYKNSLNEHLIGKYNSETPKNLLDALYSPTNEQSSEHPYEHMAIEVEKMYKSK